MKSGVEAEMRRSVDRTWNRQRNHDRNASGTDRSTASMSLENLLIILPVGVDSKNSMVLLRMDTSMRSCMVLMEAKNMPRYKKSAPKVIKPERNDRLELEFLNNLIEFRPD